MLIQSTSLAENSLVEGDVAIAGGGMAGIALARQLGDAGFDVIVLESGGEDTSPEVQALYAGKMTLDAPGSETRNLDAYLTSSRVRRFGGSGNVWGGKCAPLDPVDFEKRDWIPHSGWPIAREQLQPFYDRACKIIGLQPFGATPESVLGRKDPVFTDRSESFTVRPRRYSRATGVIGTDYVSYKRAAADHPRIKVYLDANVTRVRLSPDGRQVESLQVRELSGRAHRARARRYILALGGIENPRLLLASDDVHPNGIGNHSDWLGRAFQGHTTISQFSTTSLSLHCKPADLEIFNNRQTDRPHAVLSTTDAVQRKTRSANFTATLSNAPADSPVDDAVGIVARRLTHADARSRRGVYFMTEHTPNRDSRITLMRDDRDALQMPRVKLQMRYNALEIDSLERSIRMFAAELGRLGAGRLQCGVRREQLTELMGQPSRHHMGATRMAVAASEGVVNEDCRVHGIANLYVAGSSVFPTSGIANPTLTLLALAFRLGDHLIAELQA